MNEPIPLKDQMLRRIRATEIYVHANKDKATASKNPLEALLASPAAASILPFTRKQA